MKPQNPVRTVWLTLLSLAFVGTILLGAIVIKAQGDKIESLQQQLSDERAAHKADVDKANAILRKSVRLN